MSSFTLLSLSHQFLTNGKLSTIQYFCKNALQESLKKHKMVTHKWRLLMQINGFIINLTSSGHFLAAVHSQLVTLNL